MPSRDEGLTLREQLGGTPDPDFEIKLPAGWERRSPSDADRERFEAGLKQRFMRMQRPNLSPIRAAVPSALTALAAVVAYIVLKSAADESGTSWLRVVVIIAAVSAIMLVALELTSTPEGGDKSKDPPRRGPRSSRKRDNYLDARARVLTILQKRGLVRLDEVDGKRLTEMPLGYWDELDGVDEKEWRRILEYRHVGWREFDDSDRRPWPPAG